MGCGHAVIRIRVLRSGSAAWPPSAAASQPLAFAPLPVSRSKWRNCIKTTTIPLLKVIWPPLKTQSNNTLPEGRGFSWQFCFGPVSECSDAVGRRRGRTTHGAPCLGGCMPCFWCVRVAPRLVTRTTRGRVRCPRTK